MKCLGIPWHAGNARNLRRNMPLTGNDGKFHGVCNYVVSYEVGHVTILQRSGTCVCGEGTSRIFGPKATSAVWNGKWPMEKWRAFICMDSSN